MAVSTVYVCIPWCVCKSALGVCVCMHVYASVCVCVCVCVSHSASIHKQSDLHMLLTNMLSTCVVLKVLGSCVSPWKCYLIFGPPLVMVSRGGSKIWKRGVHFVMARKACCENFAFKYIHRGWCNKKAFGTGHSLPIMCRDLDSVSYTHLTLPTNREV